MWWKRLVSALQAAQLVMVIGVFVWYGWEKEKLAVEQQRREAKAQQDLIASSAEREKLTRELQVQTMASARAQQEIFVQLVTTFKRAEQYAVGTEILKIISGQQECFTEDQYYVIEFLTDLFRKATSEVEIDAEAFLSLAKKRKSCAEAIPANVGATTGMTVIGAPKARCTGVRRIPATSDCQGVEFTNFLVVTGSDKVEATGRLQKGSIVRAKRDIHLRSNTSDISLGGNLILGRVLEGQCAEVQESFPLLRGNTWARVAIRSCP
jgi:hypothetical protein